MKRKIWNRIAIVAGVALAAGLAWADEHVASTNGMMAPMAELTPQQFITDAAMGGMKEINAALLALDKSTNQDVRHFARRMVKDHSAANAKLAKLAEKEGFVFPPTNTFAPDDPNWNNPQVTAPEEMKGAQLLTETILPGLADYRAILQLKSLNGEAFDHAYAVDMVNDHRQVVQEFEQAAQTLPDRKLKKFAAKTLPTLRKHLKLANKLNEQEGVFFQNTNAHTPPNVTGGLALRLSPLNRP